MEATGTVTLIAFLCLIGLFCWTIYTIYRRVNADIDLEVALRQQRTPWIDPRTWGTKKY